MNSDNGPDRSIGLWRWAITGSGVLALKGGVFVVEIGGIEHETRVKSLARFLEVGNAPIDATARREAIRAGWREVGGKWVKDDRSPYFACLCMGIDCRLEPDCYERAASARDEWPKDESTGVGPVLKLSNLKLKLSRARDKLYLDAIEKAEAMEAERNQAREVAEQLASRLNDISQAIAGGFYFVPWKTQLNERTRKQIQFEIRK